MISPDHLTLDRLPKTGIPGDRSNDFNTRPISEKQILEQVIKLINTLKQNEAPNALR